MFDIDNMTFYILKDKSMIKLRDLCQVFLMGNWY